MYSDVSIRILAVLTLLICAGQSSALEISGGSEDDRAQMPGISQNWLDAYANGDLDGIMAIMHSDAMVMRHNQATSRGVQLWKSKEDADAWHTPEWIARFEEAYGAKPTVTFYDSLMCRSTIVGTTWSLMG